MVRPPGLMILKRRGILPTGNQLSLSRCARASSDHVDVVGVLVCADASVEISQEHLIWMEKVNAFSMAFIKFLHLSKYLELVLPEDN